jgi:hypothetical protein
MLLSATPKLHFWGSAVVLKAALDRDLLLLIPLPVCSIYATIQQKARSRLNPDEQSRQNDYHYFRKSRAAPQSWYVFDSECF